MNSRHFPWPAWIGVLAALVAGCGEDESPQNTSPTACFSVTPAEGTTETEFQVDATCSSDDEDAVRSLQVRWDWEGDGTWDTNYSTAKTANHLYGTAGTVTIELEVKDTGGLLGSTTQAVTVAPLTVTITVQPSTASVGVGYTEQFAATVTGTGNTAVTWSVDGDATKGTINASGLYTAPALVPSPATVTVRATSVADPGTSGTAQVTVNPVPPPSGGFVLIQPGTFTMGSPADELCREEDETQHQVTLTRAFYVSTTEITQAQWQAVMGWNGSHFEGPNRPVEEITWYDAVTYCSDRSIAEGLTPAYEITGATYSGLHITSATVSWNQSANGYRLPTEAEWEYACRAGSTTAFCNGGISTCVCDLDPNLDQVGWYCGNSGAQTHDVGTKSPNTWGLYDMHGNVEEWCWDWFAGYPGGPVTDPTGADSGSYRIRRSGAWNAWTCRSGYRHSYGGPGFTNDYFGLRLARTAP